MHMFMGEYNHTIDAKGRLIIPSKFREVLGDEFVVTKGMDGCLFVFDHPEWQAFEEKLHGLPMIDKEARQFAVFPGRCSQRRGGQAGKGSDSRSAS